jgi:hypothetical protein
VAAPAVPRTFLVLSLLAACTFDGRFASGYQCGVGGTCPAGFDCVAGYCTTEGGGDVDAGGELDPDAGTGPGIDAGDTSRFADDFGDGVFDGWIPWTNGDCTVNETAGAAQLDYTGDGESYCGIDTEEQFDLTTGAVTVEVEAPTLDNFETYVILFSDDNQQQVLMTRDWSGLVMYLRVDGFTTGSATVADPGDRHWRIQRNGATTVWATSPDGADWQIRHSTSVPIDASAMQVELAAGHYPPGTGSTVRVRFDGLVVD